MGVKRNPLGPLSHADLIQIDEVIFWDKSQPPAINSLDTDMTYLVQMADRPDYLAFRELDSSNLGWVIMELNQMRLWPDDFVPGLQIKLPSRDSLRRRGISS